MGNRANSLLRDIQSGALDGRTPISDLLRKCVALGGAAGSRRLVEWASAELGGYSSKDDVPDYRKVIAPLHIDGISGWTQFKRQVVAPSALPEFAHDVITEQVSLTQGIGTLEDLVARSSGEAILLSPPASAELVRLWNHEMDSDVQEIHRLYWSISKSEVAGVAHQIRNRLVQIIAEFEIEYESTGSTGKAVDQAVRITMGDGGNVSVVSADRNAATRVNLQSGPNPLDKPKWSVARTLWAAAVGLAGIAGSVFAYLALPK